MIIQSGMVTYYFVIFIILVMSDYLSMSHTSVTSKTLINEYNDFDDNSNDNNSYFRD